VCARASDSTKTLQPARRDRGGEEASTRRAGAAGRGLPQAALLAARIFDDLLVLLPLVFPALRAVLAALVLLLLLLVLRLAFTCHGFVLLRARGMRARAGEGCSNRAGSAPARFYKP
jgi:hypothetical protein